MATLYSLLSLSDDQQHSLLYGLLGFHYSVFSAGEILAQFFSLSNLICIALN